MYVITCISQSGCSQHLLRTWLKERSQSQYRTRADAQVRGGAPVFMPGERLKSCNKCTDAAGIPLCLQIRPGEKLRLWSLPLQRILMSLISSQRRAAARPLQGKLLIDQIDVSPEPRHKHTGVCAFIFFLCHNYLKTKERNQQFFSDSHGWFMLWLE